jgi:hypothetical protein
MILGGFLAGMLALSGVALAQSAAGGYPTEAEAKTHCGSQSVVWMNTKSHVYHMAGTKTYGHTKQGAYMCQADAAKAGRPAKNEKAATTH